MVGPWLRGNQGFRGGTWDVWGQGLLMLELCGLRVGPNSIPYTSHARSLHREGRQAWKPSAPLKNFLRRFGLLFLYASQSWH